MANDLYNLTGDGTIYCNEMMGLISRSQFLDEELPENCFLYLLSRPRRKKHTWVLEKLDQATIPMPDDDYGFSENNTQTHAFVCFVVEPEFDYLTFEDEDYETYIEWDTEHTLNDIIAHDLGEDADV